MSEEPGNDQLGNLLDHVLRDFDAGERLLRRLRRRQRFGALLLHAHPLAPTLAVLDVFPVLHRLWRRAGKSDDGPVERRMIRQIIHGGKDVRSQRLAGVLNLDRSIEQRCQVLPHVDLAFLAADEDRDRSAAAVGNPRRLGKRQRHIVETDGRGDVGRPRHHIRCLGGNGRGGCGLRRSAWRCSLARAAFVGLGGCRLRRTRARALLRRGFGGLSGCRLRRRSWSCTRRRGSFGWLG